MVTHLPEAELALPPGSTVFLTGVNGLVGSYIADELLARGYRVRGAVRSVEKSEWLVDYFEEKYGKGVMELVEVPDFTVEGCYDGVVKDTSAIIHTASPLSGSPSSIPPTVLSSLNILRAASATPSISRVVLTSSSLAASYASPGVLKRLTQDTFNEDAISLVDGINDDTPPKEMWRVVYPAMKAESERACWAYMAQERRSFDMYAVLPSVCFGAVLVPREQGAASTIAWGKAAWTGENLRALSEVVGPQWAVGVRDAALLHVAAVLKKDLPPQRIFAYAHRWSFNSLLSSYRAMFPDRKFPDDLEGEVEDGCKAPREEAEELLRWIKGSGWEGWEGIVGEMGGMIGRGEV